MLEVERILKRTAKLVMDKSCLPKSVIKLITLQYISVAVVQATGGNIPGVITTEFASLTMPFWETFQIQYKNTEMIVYVS